MVDSEVTKSYLRCFCGSVGLARPFFSMFIIPDLKGPTGLGPKIMKHLHKLFTPANIHEVSAQVSQSSISRFDLKTVSIKQSIG